MSMLQEIIEGATDDKTSLATVLRKCRILATRLKHEPLKEWVDRELNGYKNHLDLPDYRITSSQACGHFRGPAGASISNQPIPPALLDESHQDFARKAYLIQPIASYEHFITETRDGKSNSSLRIDWPNDLVLYYQNKFISYYGLIAAWQVLPLSSVVGMLDTVRNRVLSFSLEIETTAPSAGSRAPQSQQISMEKLNQTFTTIILGGSNVFAPGSSGVSQVGAISVHSGDLGSLKAALTGLGLSPDDLTQLDEALESDPPPTSGGRFGPKISGWIGKLAGKAASGALKVTTDVATKVATAALSKYYGLE